MSYLLEIDPLADKQAQRLDRKALKRLEKRMQELARAPYDPRLSKPVTMSRDRRSSRVGRLASHLLRGRTPPHRGHRRHLSPGQGV